MAAATPTEPLSLDTRLIEVTLDLIEREGLEQVSLRRIARRAGVSHGAPHRHFPSLANLLAAVAARGFERLEAAVEASGASLPPGAGARARLAAGGRAYVETAVAHPGLFALMFRPDQLDTGQPDFRRASHAAFEQLVRHVRAAQDAGWHAHRETRELAGVVWAMVHGLATLWSQGAFAGPVPDASLEALLATTGEMLLGRPDANASQPGDSRS